MYVLLNKHTHIGCCSISYNSDNKASIGLFGIDPNSSGRGFGAILIHKVLSEMHKNDVKSVSVVTQGRNYLAQKLYQRAGFCNEKWKYTITNGSLKMRSLIYEKFGINSCEDRLKKTQK